MRRAVCSSSKGFRTPCRRWASCVGVRHRLPRVGRAYAGPADWRATACSGAFTTTLTHFAAGVSEDCLYLNVWTQSTGGRRPVMVWIHGGGFFAGFGGEERHHGGRLTQKGAVVVTVNYRLDAFGFFAHPALTAESPRRASGNYGLLDQIAALEWVQRNIARLAVTHRGSRSSARSPARQLASPVRPTPSTL